MNMLSSSLNEGLITLDYMDLIMVQNKTAGVFSVLCINLNT